MPRDVWSLTTDGDPPCVPPAAAGQSNGIPPLPHIFHIHVNPFQATRLDPAGQPEVVWKDTVLVPPAANGTLCHPEARRRRRIPADGALVVLRQGIPRRLRDSE